MARGRLLGGCVWLLGGLALLQTLYLRALPSPHPHPPPHRRPPPPAPPPPRGVLDASGSYWVYWDILGGPFPNWDPPELILATHGTPGRVAGALGGALGGDGWGGPLSVAVFGVPRRSLEELLAVLRGPCRQLRPRLRLHVVTWGGEATPLNAKPPIGTGGGCRGGLRRLAAADPPSYVLGVPYPGNLLRNVAWGGALGPPSQPSAQTGKSSFVLLVDADVVPSRGLREEFLAMLGRGGAPLGPPNYGAPRGTGAQGGPSATSDHGVVGNWEGVEKTGGAAVLGGPGAHEVLENLNRVEEPKVLGVNDAPGDPKKLGDTNVPGANGEPGGPNVLENPNGLRDPGGPNVLEVPNALEDPNGLRDPGVPNVLENLNGLEDPNGLKDPKRLGGPNVLENLNRLGVANALHDPGVPNALEDPNGLKDLDRLSGPNALENHNVLEDPNGLHDPGVPNVLENLNALKDPNGLEDPNALENPNALHDPGVPNVLENLNRLGGPNALHDPGVPNVLENLNALKDLKRLEVPNALENPNPPTATRPWWDRVLFVLPAFEIRAGTRVPGTKAELLRLWGAGQARPFYGTLCPRCQAPTDYGRWRVLPPAPRLRVAYEVPWRDPWEPFYVGPARGAPPFDERFLQYGFNRISQACELHVAGFRFAVLDGAFVAHRGFKEPGAFHGAREAELRRNRLLFRRFRDDLRRRYPRSPRRC